MKRAFSLLVVLAVAVLGGTGCAGSGQQCASGNCGGGPGGYGGGHVSGKRGLLESFSGGLQGGGQCAGCADCAGGGMQGMPPQAPPPSPGGVAYPYYTNRGPRDFLLNNPPSIGPY